MTQASEDEPLDVSATRLINEFCATAESLQHPTLTITCPRATAGSDDIGGHLYCRISCRAQLTSLDCEWWQQRRLCALREGLLEPLQEELGAEKYDLLWEDISFPWRGGLWVPGNGQRLQAWLKRLGELMSQGKLATAVLRLVMKFLCSPSFSALELAELPKKPWCLGRSLLPDADDEGKSVAESTDLPTVIGLQGESESQ